MTGEQIKAECDKLYQQIETAKIKLEEIRNVCPHDHVFNGNWSWRLGSTLPAIICEDCGNLIKLKMPIMESQNDMIKE